MQSNDNHTTAADDGGGRWGDHTRQRSEHNGNVDRLVFDDDDDDDEEGDHNRNRNRSWGSGGDDDENDDFSDHGEDGILFTLIGDGGAHNEDCGREVGGGRRGAQDTHMFDSLSETSTVSLERQVSEYHVVTQNQITELLNTLRKKTLDMNAMHESESLLARMSPVEWNPYRPPRGEQYKSRLEALQILEWRDIAERALMVEGSAVVQPNVGCNTTMMIGVDDMPMGTDWGVEWFPPHPLQPNHETQVDDHVDFTSRCTPSGGSLLVVGRGISIPTPMTAAAFQLRCALGGNLEELIEAHNDASSEYLEEEVFAVGHDPTPVDESRRMACGLPPLSPHAAMLEEQRDAEVIAVWERDVVPWMRSCGLPLPAPYDEMGSDGTDGLGEQQEPEAPPPRFYKDDATYPRHGGPREANEGHQSHVQTPPLDSITKPSTSFLRNTHVGLHATVLHNQQPMKNENNADEQRDHPTRHRRQQLRHHQRSYETSDDELHVQQKSFDREERSAPSLVIRGHASSASGGTSTTQLGVGRSSRPQHRGSASDSNTARYSSTSPPPRRTHSHDSHAHLPEAKSHQNLLPPPLSSAPMHDPATVTRWDVNANRRRKVITSAETRSDVAPRTVVGGDAMQQRSHSNDGPSQRNSSGGGVQHASSSSTVKKQQHRYGVTTNSMETPPRHSTLRATPEPQPPLPSSSPPLDFTVGSEHQLDDTVERGDAGDDIGGVKLPDITLHHHHSQRHHHHQRHAAATGPMTSSMKSLHRAQTAYVRPTVKKSVV